MTQFRRVLLSLLLFPLLAVAQKGGQDEVQCMPGMPMPGCPAPTDQQAPPKDSRIINSRAEDFIQEIERHDSSGTSAEPDSTPIPMWMTIKRQWMVMFHANFFMTDEQQSSSRGGDKLFSTNWSMLMAQHNFGRGVFTIRTMLSLEPLTITDRRYPLLFQQGETAFGIPIADGQHPHNFFMEVAALYDLKLTNRSLLSLYIAPVGDPAIGPAAYPHRASALENPLATLGHHQEDSTHVADDVVTIGLTYRIARIEASVFHCREPGENRWIIHQGSVDSWSSRLTVQPGKNWSGQYSYARIKSPEGLFPNENQERMTSSVMYNRPLLNGNWASTMLWGRTRSLQDNSIFNSYLLESSVRFRARHYAWARIENAERSNELILGENAVSSVFKEEPIGRVQAYTLGYDHDFDLIPHMSSAIGAQVTVYGAPAILKPVYGSNALGVALFIRLRQISNQER